MNQIALQKRWLLLEDRMCSKNSKEKDQASFRLNYAYGRIFLGFLLLGTTTACLDDYVKNMRLENPLGGPKADMVVAYGDHELLDGDDASEDQSPEGAERRHKKRRHRRSNVSPVMMMPTAPPGTSYEEEESGEGGRDRKSHGGRKSATPATEVNYGDGDE
ncbi:hypothetical protein RF55_6356 [Lasius niger]|uniref:Uncharacterized protein n=1 Tax=Lasius niger TaxID=67767 RepID=A0A0J7KTH6_LASNI|nr:hypothetical protein RF55_6356 [Lasius niger]